MSQVNFFMTVEDEAGFADFLARRKDTLAVAGRTFSSPNPSPIELTILPTNDAKDITLLHSELSESPSEVTDGIYHYKLFSQAFIEFNRCQFDEDVMVSGRIYAKIGWLETPEANRQFESWYRSIERWIRKRYTRFRGKWWIGPGAEDWSRQGGKLALGSRLAAHVSLAD